LLVILQKMPMLNCALLGDEKKTVERLVLPLKLLKRILLRVWEQ